MRAEEFMILDETSAKDWLSAAAMAGVMGYGASHYQPDVDTTSATQSAPTTQVQQTQQKQQPPQLTKKVQPAQKAQITLPPPKNANEEMLRKVARQAGIKGIELLAFLAQMDHESAGFTDMTENNPDLERYARHPNLGNKDLNDAERFKGRGFIQLTGRWNYKNMQDKLGIDLTSTWSKAHQAATPSIAAKIAVQFWNDRVKSKLGDDPKAYTNVFNVSAAINGVDDKKKVPNGLKDRAKRFERYVAYAKANRNQG